MKLRRLYFNLSIKYKILVLVYSVILAISLMFGVYSYMTSSKYIISKASLTNLEVIRQISSSIDFLQNDIVDISTYLCIDSVVQALLESNISMMDSVPEDQLRVGNSLKFITNLIASKSYISSIIMYSNSCYPLYYEFTDMSSGPGNLPTVVKNDSYLRALSKDGAPVWFTIPEGEQDFIYNNTYPKIAMCRIMKSTNSYKHIGFLVLCINENIIRNMFQNCMQSNSERIMIMDDTGSVILHTGENYFNSEARNQFVFDKVSAREEGFYADKTANEKLLVTHTTVDSSRWKIIHIVPMKILTSEIKSMKMFSVIVVFTCLIVSLPLILLISSFVTAPIKKLLKSMEKFQEGNFDEKVEFKYNDEIGMLGRGYNTMVANIRELVDKAYVLQIREREAELNALQAQINPHFLYNMLDTIFWKSQGRGETEISEMVYSLSKVFRLSLNRGKEYTLVSSEKELIEHYLALQKVRFKQKLNYRIGISKDIECYIIPKLILQPFVENAVIHGLGGKENGGTITITGQLNNGKLHFMIQDDGTGMSMNCLKSLSNPKDEDNLNVSMNTGKYAIKNVNERLKLIFGSSYSLSFSSEPDYGTVVSLIVPAMEYDEKQEV